jgi:hypothetical protein
LYPTWAIADNYKYHLYADGNNVAWRRPQEVMMSNSLLLMPESSSRVEFLYNELVPYKHYVPLKHDLSDLEEVFEWLENN